MIDFIDKDILNYVESNSQNEPLLLKELNRETHLKVLNPRMLSGSYQGRLLSLLSKRFTVVSFSLIFSSEIPLILQISAKF